MAKWIETIPDDSSSSSSSEEEALSLCDLPNKNMTADNLDEEEEAPLVGDDKEDSEFDFRWWGNNHTNINNDSQMCAADELFFNGQILPLRHSDTTFLRSMSRSDSLDDGSVTRFIGSRSSSIGSHYSSASSSNSSSINSNYYNNNIITTRRRRRRNPPLQKPIHHPIGIEAKPQIINNAANYNSQHRQSNPKMSQQPPYGSKSTVWDLFRTGLVRGPEIHLRSNFRKLPSKNGDVTATSKKSSRRQGFFHRIGAGGGFLSGGSCKCSVDTVVPTTTEILLTGNNGGAGALAPHSRSDKDEGTLLLRYSKSSTVMMRRENGKKEKVKEAMSRRRASEWLKELSLSHQSNNSCRTRSNELLGKRMISRVP